MFHSKGDACLYSYRKVLSSIITFFFSFSIIFPPQLVQAQNISTLHLPLPGTFVTPTSQFVPPLIKGIEFHPENPFQFDFIIDTGQKPLDDQELREENLYA